MTKTEISNFSITKILAIVFIVPLMCFSFLTSYQEVTTIFMIAVLLWLTEALPLPVTALLIPIMGVLFGVVSPTKAFLPFGSDILFLFLGCFLMGISMEKHGFDRRVAYWLLSRCLPSETLFSINFVIILASFILSMWISNTAATAILSAVALGIIATISHKLHDRTIINNFSVRCVLGCAFAASIGGLATPVGSPPNLIALQFLAERNVEMTFFQWLKIGLPVSIIMLIIMFIIFEIRYPIRYIALNNIRAEFKDNYNKLGCWNRGEKQIALVFMLTIILWITPGVIKEIFSQNDILVAICNRLSMSVVALLGGVALFFLPLKDKGRVVSNMQWPDVAKIEWGTILLFGGGLTLGHMLEDSGAAKVFGEMIFQSGITNIYILLPLIIVICILLSEFASNTAATAILVPLVIGSAEALNLSANLLETLVLCVAFSASFGFMLPVSTPPNAIVYGTGKIRSSDMIHTGAWFDISGAIVIATLVLVGLI